MENDNLKQEEQCAIHDVMCSCNCKCDGCGKMYYEPNIKFEFGEFNICDDCKNNPNIQFEQALQLHITAEYKRSAYAELN